jgi:phospholipid/cholesterol/gamma-HCH transport system substrate-binding protein
MRRLLAIACALAAVTLILALPAAGDDDGPYKIRAVFDNGSFVVKDEEVRIAGARVGKVESVDVSQDDEIVSLEDGPTAIPGKAVVVLEIQDDGFKDFREDASCQIRPQSLIGERFVDCEPTQPRAPGSEPPPELEVIEDGQPGEGQRLLPVENNGKAVDIDLINNISRIPYRDRFRLILNDLGAGLAARGEDLGEIVDRANPALRQTNRVLSILAQQNRQLAELASNGDRVLQPLAENRTSITGFLRNAAIAGEASAERGEDIELGLERLPRTLQEVRLTMNKLKQFSDRGIPLMADLKLEAADLSAATQKLAPLARAGTPALRTLGDAAESSGPKLVEAKPVVDQLADLGAQTGPTSIALSKLLDTFTRTNGWQNLWDFVYNASGLVNGFDANGHFQRAVLQITTCQDLVTTVVSGCEATFVRSAGAASAAALEERAAAGGVKPDAEPTEDGSDSGEALPPIDELVPELEPIDPDQPDDTTTTQPDPADEDPAEEADPIDQDQADEAAAATSSTRSAGWSMGDASTLLRYLLGESAP